MLKYFIFSILLLYICALFTSCKSLSDDDCTKYYNVNNMSDFSLVNKKLFCYENINVNNTLRNAKLFYNDITLFCANPNCKRSINILNTGADVLLFKNNITLVCTHPDCKLEIDILENQNTYIYEHINKVNRNFLV